MSRKSHSSRRHLFAAASDVKIIFIGDHNCGKSGLLTSFSKIDNNDSEVFIPKNCDFNVLNTTSVDDSNNGKKKNISIWESISSPDHDFYFGTDFILLSMIWKMLSRILSRFRFQKLNIFVQKLDVKMIFVF